MERFCLTKGADRDPPRRRRCPRLKLQANGFSRMFSVIFEVHPKRSEFELYLALAKDLKPILEGIDGFIDNERFESKRRPGWILSHSTWRDEKSVVR